MTRTEHLFALILLCFPSVLFGVWQQSMTAGCFFFTLGLWILFLFGALLYHLREG